MLAGTSIFQLTYFLYQLPINEKEFSADLATRANVILLFQHYGIRKTLYDTNFFLKPLTSTLCGMRITQNQHVDREPTGCKGVEHKTENPNVAERTRVESERWEIARRKREGAFSAATNKLSPSPGAINLHGEYPPSTTVQIKTINSTLLRVWYTKVWRVSVDDYWLLFTWNFPVTERYREQENLAFNHEDRSTDVWIRWRALLRCFSKQKKEIKMNEKPLAYDSI